MSEQTVCVGIFMDGDDFHIVCVGSQSQCKSAIRDYGHAHARQQRGCDYETRVFRKQQRHGKTSVRGYFEIQEWPMGGVSVHYSLLRAQGKSILDDHPYKVVCTFDGDGKERKR